MARSADKMLNDPETLRLLATVLDRPLIAADVRRLALLHANLIERHAKLRKNLLDIQFSASGYCPACSGWNADPKDPKRGCTPGVHMKDCWLAAAIKED